MDDNKAPAGGVFAELSTASKVIGVVVTAASAWSAYQVSALNSKVAELTAERSYATQIMDRYDKVVTDTGKDANVRLARLAGIVTLADLISAERPELRKSIMTAIQRQTKVYEGALETTLASATTAAEQAKVNNQLDQLDAIQQAAQESLDELAPAERAALPLAVPPAAAGSRPANFADYRFDIFWCSGTPQSDAVRRSAETVLALQNAGGVAAGRWRLRPLDPATNSRSGYQQRGYNIRVSSDDEMVPARYVAELAKARGLTFAIQRAATPTPNYVSVFICPAASAGGGRVAER